MFEINISVVFHVSDVTSTGHSIITFLLLSIIGQLSVDTRVTEAVDFLKLLKVQVFSFLFGSLV